MSLSVTVVRAKTSGHELPLPGSGRSGTIRLVAELFVGNKRVLRPSSEGWSA